MTEAELAIEEKLRKKREEQEQIWQEYLEIREKQRQKEEEDLRKLKERQQRRKAQRAEQERLMQEMRRKQEEQRQFELEERRNREAEAKRQRLEEAEKKRLAMQEAIKKRDEQARRNFVVPKRSGDPGQSGPMIVGIRDVMKTKEQLAEDKRIAMQYRIKPLKIQEGMRAAELRRLVNELWHQIVQLESDKYDLAEEQRRQEYHLKELTERQKLINRNKALKMGVEPDELMSAIPPKVRLASKYERKVDRRSFKEKTSLFDGGYVEQTKEMLERNWTDKTDQFMQGHADKHVPKWDPSAPRKEVYEPGQVIYEDSEDEDDELVDKLRNYVQQQQQRPSQSHGQPLGSNQTSRRESAVQQQQPSRASVDLARRRSSQISNSSQMTTGNRSQVGTRAPAQQTPVLSRQSSQQKQQPQQVDDEEEYEDEEYEEEEYTDEEVEE